MITEPSISPPELVKPASASRPAGRLLSLDVFRGLTIVGMILVNNPGSWGNLYWPLGHADWHGWTPTDLIFPFFLFIVGTSLAYSLRKYVSGAEVDAAVYGRIIRRTLVLILLGLGLGVSYRVFSFLAGNVDTIDLSSLRYPGVLQRIAVVYFLVSLLVLYVGVRGQAVLAIGLLFGYWVLLAFLPIPQDYTGNLSRTDNLVRVIDRAVIGDTHMWTRATTEPTDPEGLLSTLPAIATVLLGYWTGLVIQKRGVNMQTVGLLLAVGLVLTMLGLSWGLVLPINKKLWTSSFVALTGGLAMIVLAGCLLKFDVWGWRRLARPWEIVGINAIFVFVASGLVAQLLGVTHVGDMSTHNWLYSKLFTSWIGDSRLASLAFAVTVVTCWWIILWAMSRRGWSVRV